MPLVGVLLLTESHILRASDLLQTSFRCHCASMCFIPVACWATGGFPGGLFW